MSATARAPLTAEQRASVAGFKQRWSDPAAAERDAVAAFENKNLAEAKLTLHCILAFLATAPREPYHEVAQRIIGAAVELALRKPRLEVLDWLDEAQVLYGIDDLPARVTACPFQDVHLWFERKALDSDVAKRRFAEPVDSAKRERRPLDAVMAPLRYPDGTTSRVRVEEAPEYPQGVTGIAADEQRARAEPPAATPDGRSETSFLQERLTQSRTTATHPQAADKDEDGESSGPTE